MKKIWLKAKILTIYGTQRAFARACGKSDDWVSRIVNGVSNPSAAEKNLLAEKLGIDYFEATYLEPKASNKSRNPI